MFQRRVKYASKTTMNLMRQDLPPGYVRNLCVGTVVGTALLALFAQFGVLAPLTRVETLERQVMETRQELSLLTQNNARFPYVLAEYQTYFADIYATSVSASTEQVLRLIEGKLMPRARVRSATFDGERITVVLAGVDLDGATELIRALYQNEFVSGAEISWVDSATQPEDSSVAMQILLQGSQEAMIL